MLENLDAGSSRSSAKSNARPGLPPSRECAVVPMPLTTFSKAKRTVDSVNLYDPATWQRGTGRKTHLSWPSSPPARQAAAPVRGGEESGLAPRQQQRRTGYTHTQWVSYDWFSGSKKIERRPPEADPRGVDSRGVGCGDNWTGGGLRGKRLTASSAHSASTSVHKKWLEQQKKALKDPQSRSCKDSVEHFKYSAEHLCCIDLICSSCLIRQLLRPQRAHLRRSNLGQGRTL